MLKSEKLTKILLPILCVIASIAVIIIAFVGIYVPKLNKLKNIIPDYKLGSEVDGIIEYRFVPDDSEEEKEVYVDSKGAIRGIVSDGSKTSSSSESVEVTSELEEAEATPVDDTGFAKETRTIRENEASVLTKENFEKSKKILEERLENAKATEYAIRLDDKTGNMVIELSQNDDIAYLYQVALSAHGEFDIIDYQTGVVLMDKSHLKNAQAVAYPDSETNKYTIYLQLELDEAGRNIIKEISKQYIQYTDSEGTEQTDRVSIRVDGAAIMTPFFGEEYDNAVLNIPISKDVESVDVEQYKESVEAIAFLLNHETIPIKYTQEGRTLFIESTLADNTMDIIYWSVIVILIIVFITFFVMFRARGLLAGIMNACLIGLVMLVLKYVKVVISISSLVALYGVIVLNIIFLYQYLNRLKQNKENAYFATMKNYYAIVFPLVVVSFIYTFFVSVTVAGLGSVLFWGMLLQIIYNTIIVKYVLDGK